MFGWLRELLEIRQEFRERKTLMIKEVSQDERTCPSCETLKQQLEIANYEKEKLLNKLLEKPDQVPERSEAPPMVTRPKTITWAMRRQMLEQEDRVKAQILRNAPKPDAETEMLEKELGVASVSEKISS